MHNNCWTHSRAKGWITFILGNIFIFNTLIVSQGSVVLWKILWKSSLVIIASKPPKATKFGPRQENLEKRTASSHHSVASIIWVAVGWSSWILFYTGYAKGKVRMSIPCVASGFVHVEGQVFWRRRNAITSVEASRGMRMRPLVERAPPPKLLTPRERNRQQRNCLSISPVIWE